VADLPLFIRHYCAGGRTNASLPVAVQRGGFRYSCFLTTTLRLPFALPIPPLPSFPTCVRDTTHYLTTTTTSPSTLPVACIGLWFRSVWFVGLNIGVFYFNGRVWFGATRLCCGGRVWATLATLLAVPAVVVRPSLPPPLDTAALHFRIRGYTGTVYGVVVRLVLATRLHLLCHFLLRAFVQT